MGCPEPDRLQALVDGTLSGSDRAAVAAHADDCEACRAAVVELFRLARQRPASPGPRSATGDPATEATVSPSSDPATDETVSASRALATDATVATGDLATGSTAGVGIPVHVGVDPDPLAPGTTIDRYLIEGRLGAGAMGVVYAARDPELDRKVAIKLLRHGRGDDGLRARLLREAQALAKVDHTNVVGVYDVGTHDDKVFVAMELVRGETLRVWLARPGRTWREVIDTVVAAGRGLAAAHAAGLVHRDVKPDNILVGDDGVARVTDFGLARATAGATDDGDDIDGRAGSDPVTAGSPLGSTLTATGSMLGTPVYAPPEQLSGETVGPLADQFAFCVTAYEAMYGHRPYKAATLDALVVAIERGELQPPPADRRIPGRIHRAIVRGLAAKPDQRWPAMDDLLLELAPPPRRWPWIAAGAATIAVATAAIAVTVAGGDAPARCRSADERLAGVWDAARRGKVTAAFAALPGYGDSGPRLVDQLDQYAARWRDGWRAACTATEQSATMFDLRVACLDRRRNELDAIGRILVTVDRDVAAAAPQLIGALGAIETCADAEALAAAPAPAAAQRPAVDEVQHAIATATASLRARKHADARAVLEPALVKAQATGFPPIVAKTQLMLAELEREVGHHAQAETAARAASTAAMAANDRDLIALSLLALSGIRSEQGDVDGAAESLELAAGTITAMGPAASRVTRYEYADAMALLRVNQARGPEAIPYFDQAIELLDQEPVDKLRLATELTQRGQVFEHLGKNAEARASLDRGLALMTEVMGADHPNVAVVHGAYAAILADERKFQEAIDMITQAYQVMVETLGPEATSTIEAEQGLAGLAVEIGDYPGALGHLEHIIAVASKMDPRANEVMLARMQVAEVRRRMGDPARAADELAALRTDIAAQQGEGVFTGYTDLIRAFALTDLGKLADAAPLLDHAEELVKTSFGTEVEEYGQVMWARGRNRLAQGKLAAALADLKTARAVFDRIAAPYFQTRTELLLAEALWNTGDHAGATAAAAKARVALDELSPTANAPLRDEITAWQRAHP